MYTGTYNGFTELDHAILSLLTNTINIKLSHLRERLVVQHKNLKIRHIISSITSALEMRTSISLLIKLKELLPPLLQYEHIGLYFHDSSSTLLRDNR